MNQIPIPNTNGMDQKSLALIARAQAVKIRNQADYEGAAYFLREIKTSQDEVKKTFAESKALSDKAHKAICAAEKKHLDPRLQAEAILKEEMRVYLRAEDLKIKAEQERLRREAQEKADADRRAAIKKQEEDRIRMAQELEARGQVEKANEVLEAPIYVAPAVPQVIPVLQKPTAAGIAPKKKLTFRVNDENLVPREFLSVDESKIRKYIAYKGDEAVIAGVIIEEDINVSARKF